MVTTEPYVSADELDRSLGWHLRPEGLCQGDRCLPLPADAVTADGLVDVRALAARGFGLAHDEARGLWALGPQAGSTLASDELAPLPLTGLDGTAVDAAELLGPDRGVLLAFASW
jgi:hypothetical protein